jgi:hypothetical protein
MDKVYQLQNLCEILGIDLKQKILEEVDSSIDNPNEWIAKSQVLDEMSTERLSSAVGRLSQLKTQRFNQVCCFLMALRFILIICTEINLSSWCVLFFDFFPTMDELNFLLMSNKITEVCEI